MRRQIVAGNWKMNLEHAAGLQLVREVLAAAKPAENTRVLFCPPFVHLAAVQELVAGADRFHAGAQNCHSEDSGAYTGEVSAAMIRSIGVDHVILGHSERREYQQEGSEELNAKVRRALDADLHIVFCCGESREMRESGDYLGFVAGQLKETVLGLSPEEFSRILIAYEPVWAIGTGLTASAEQAQEMHAHLRAAVAATFGQQIADDCSILYGGSCKPGNAAELFSQPDVDGGLIGGASLKSADFTAIIDAIPA